MDLEDCCRGLESTKITDRVKNIKQILILLQNVETLEKINTGKTFAWDHIVYSVYICLMKDADKYAEDIKKRKTSVVNTDAGGRTFFDVVTVAIKESTSLDFTKLFSYVKSILDRKVMKEYYAKPCLVTLKDHILCSSRFRSHLESNDWVELFELLKSLCENQQSLIEYNYVQVECLELLIKWGPMYSLPPETLREEFKFITEMCKTITQSSLRSQKEIIVKIVYQYSLCMAKDNRLACCKLGEEVFIYFIDLYEINVREDKLKILLIDFFLLLVVLHHPSGVTEEKPTAYAYDWQNWKRCLRSVYRLLYEEIELNLKCKFKNLTLFVRKEDRQELCQDFISLFVEVGRQVLNKVDLDVSMAAASTSTSVPSQAKRQKSEITMKKLIDNISSTKKWPWIQVAYSVLNIYPDMISTSDYVFLLQILMNLQKEYDDQELRHHIYRCLLILESIEVSVCLSTADQLEVSTLWRNIGEAILKEVGLNLCSEETENLLQKLLTKRNVFNSVNTLEVFNSGTVITERRIKLLNVYGQNFGFQNGQNDCVQVNLMKTILNRDNVKRMDYLPSKATAKFLVSLILKQWPSNNVSAEDALEKPRPPFHDISEIYLKTSFEDILVYKQTAKKEVNNFQIPSVDDELKKCLFETLISFIDNFENLDIFDVETTLKVTILFKNIIDELNKYEISLELSTENSSQMSFALENLSQHFISNFSNFLISPSEHVAVKLIQYLDIFCKFIEENDNSFIISKVMSLVSSDFLKGLFEILNDHEVGEKRRISSDDIKLKLTLHVMKVLSTYCFISCGEMISQTQLHAFEAIIGSNCDTTKEYDYTLAKTFLLQFNNSTPGCLPEESLQLLLDFLQKICKVRYNLYESATDILVSLKALLLHLKVVPSEPCLSHIIQLISPFYARVSNYGPKVAVLIIECLELVCELDSNLGCTKCVEDEEILTSMCNFLCNDFQEVRFTAIKSITNLFSQEITNHRLYNVQKEVFKKIFQLSLQVFEIQGNISSERRIDETVTRSGSVLHTFASLALSNTIWLQESLFSLLRITHIKKLNATGKVLSLIAKHLESSDEVKLLEMHVEYILERWSSFSYSLDNFPFYLYKCDAKIDFCVKYLKAVAPFLIKNERETLTLVLQKIGRNVKEILEEFSPKVLSYCICLEKVYDMKSLMNKSGILTYLIDALGIVTFKESILNNIEEFLSYILQAVLDEEDFKSEFNISVIFPSLQSTNLSVKQFHSCLAFIRTELSNGENIFIHLIKNKPYKLHKLVFELKEKLDETNTDKVRIFHSYHLTTSLILRKVKQENGFHEYFIRDTISYLLNLMEYIDGNSKLRLLASQSLYKIIRLILPTFASSIMPLFHVMVNKLNNLALRSETHGNHCINILKVIIIENSDVFNSSIEMLDPFPSERKFKELEMVYFDVKYKNQDVSLEKDIRYFLDCGYHTRCLDTREEGLKHLEKQLSSKKEELNELYSKLKEKRGFSEDCEESLLHQLICMLVKLSCSSKPGVSIEACKCLGELGPANLFSLILKPEKIVQPPNLSPLEVLCGQITSRLLLYVIDPDVKLIKAATEGLCEILSSKEGKKVLKSEADFGYGSINSNYLVPFILSPKHKPDSLIKVAENVFVSMLNHEELWSPKQRISHEDWVTTLACSVLETFSDKCCFPKLVSVCKQKPEFCEEILPYLFYFVVAHGKRQLVDLIFDKMNHFFEDHWEMCVVQRRNCEAISQNKSSVRCMLNCAYYIRLMFYSNKQKQTVEKFELNYLRLAQAAHFCSQHFAAILYAELWCYSKYGEITDNSTRTLPGNKMLEVVNENVDKTTALALENILRSSYKILGEFDALSGCGTSLVLNPLRRAEHHKELGRWDQAVLYYDIEISHKSVSVANLTDSLKHSSLYKLPLLFHQDEEPQFECLWRLSQWNVSEAKKSNDCNNDHKDFEKYRYFALKYLHEKDQLRVKDFINEARMLEIDKIKNTSLDSCRNLYEILARLQSLREIENFSEVEGSVVEIDKLLEKWKSQDNFLRNEFAYVEPIKTQRIIILNDFVKTVNYPSEILVDSMLNLTEYSRNEGYLNMATRTLGNIHYVENLTDEIRSKIQFVDAQLCWSLNDKTSAHHLLRQLCNNNDVDVRIRSLALKLTGKWLIESLSENKNTIITDYLLESLKVYTNLDRTPEDVKNIIEAYDELGRFSDKQYQQIMAHMNSDMFQQKIKNIRKQRMAASEIKGAPGKKKLTSDETKAVRVHEQQSLIDEIEIQNAEKEKNVFVKFALKYYLLNLISSDDNNIRIFRIISLFFENRNNSEITETINTYLPRVPTYKYITVLPQVIPHLSSANENLFSEHINNVIRKCAKEHPHHTLPLILSLAYSNKDREYSNSTTATSSNDSRISSANDLLKKLKKDKNLNSIITKMEFLSDALIQLAYCTVKPTSTTSDDKSEIAIPSSWKIRKIRNYSDVLLPTYNLAVSKDCSYDNLVGICSFGDTYETVGGINAPKRITCRGTDGKIRTQLVKGSDDLRQDAVMQQVFTIINSLLFANKNTKNLVIRTYKIVPLSMRSGVLEWVDNSMPIGVYLTGEKKIPGAHQIYRPKDKRPSECRSIFKRCAGRSADEQLEIYNSVCQMIKPVFHKFFEYSFPQPSVWYERRRAYTYSVATTSMCGYILGLGDRHVQNILIDKNTAEVIHIDFGIAFEQGRVLPTPETVPFRLTRDIVDGMGVSGVEGIFRRSCEKTMEVLRNNSQTIVTILEVLLYDPLYVWTVTSSEANKRQNDRDVTDSDFSSSPTENSDVNVTAERALLRLTSKLNGTEDGYPTSLEHQVGTLIQQAQDPANLCKLFCGWQPYL